MTPDDLVRIVRIRRGKCKVSDFFLRPGERGLSLFERSETIGLDAIIQAVRDAGKQGDLAAALVPIRVFRSLKLVMVKSEGQTPDPLINATHWEARLGFWISFRLWLSRRPRGQYFNENYAPKLFEESSILE